LKGNFKGSLKGKPKENQRKAKGKLKESYRKAEAKLKKS
jgi:hypothetical protein